MFRTVRTVWTDHVDWRSDKGFEEAVRDLAAELGKAGAQALMDRLARDADWDELAAQCATLGGRGGLVEFGRVDWGRLAAPSGAPLRARCFIIGDPLGAQKLLAAGGAALGLYLPGRILVFEAPDGEVHVAYDRLPLMAPPGQDRLSAVAAAIDALMDRLAQAAAG